MYKLTLGNAVIRLSDNAFIPFVTGNADYAKYLEWQSAGGMPSPADPAPAPAPAPVPTVTTLQGLLAIDQGGLSSVYESWANDPARTFAQKAFINKAQTWKRDDPTLAAAATSLGLTEAQVDGLFTLAATL